jgi:MFS transporter, DHA2 family, multidrug resistance protein
MLHTHHRGPPVTMVPASGPLGARTWVGFIAMSIGMFMAILDVQIVASSLPEIQAGLTIPLDRLSWVQTAYLMAEIVAIPLTGWLTRVMSTRGAFVVCVLGFTAASVACATASGFWWLVSARVVQGFCGGFLIPLAFSAVFVMFDGAARIRATMIAGIMAMLAPTLGPSVGGFITAHFSWHWLFLINLPPGIVVALLASAAVTVDRPRWRHFGAVDLVAVPLLAVFLATLQWVLSQAPRRGWSDPAMLALIALCVMCGAGTLRRCLRHNTPLVDLTAFRDRNFAFACWFSFVLGVGLYGATYLLPLFLGLVRGHDSLEIGTIMMVTGAAQLVSAPFATLLERRVDARVLIAAGYTLLAAGFLGNGEMTPATDFWGLTWQQVARGCGFMLCLLPTTSLALGRFEASAVPNASGLFNLMRNLGGAIGLALIDTVIAQRAPAHVAALVARLQAGDVAAARFVGLPVEEFSARVPGPIDQATRDFVAPLLERAGLAGALNDAWLLIGGFVLLSLLMLPFLRPASAATAKIRHNCNYINK